jgi:hypothetical protein
VAVAGIPSPISNSLTLTPSEGTTSITLDDVILSLHSLYLTLVFQS